MWASRDGHQKGIVNIAITIKNPIRIVAITFAMHNDSVSILKMQHFSKIKILSLENRLKRLVLLIEIYPESDQEEE